MREFDRSDRPEEQCDNYSEITSTLSNEQIRQQGFEPSDFYFAQALLGTEIPLDPDIPLDEYDERREICRRVIQCREEMRASMVEWTYTQNIPLTDELIWSWEPNEIELEALRKAVDPYRKRLRMIKGIEEFGIDQAEVAHAKGVPLRDYQLDAMEGFFEFLTHAPRNERGGKRGIIEMPTGTGKSGPIVDAAAKLKYGEDPDDPEYIFILTPTLDISEQIARTEFPRFAPHLADKVGVYNRFIQELDAEIVLISNASFCNLAREGKLPKKRKLIVDEAHMVIGDKTSKYIDKYVSEEDTELIGFTATVEYNSEHSVYTKLFDHEIYGMGFRDAVHSGRLAPVRGYVHPVQPLIDGMTLSNDPRERRKQIRAAGLKARIDHAERILKQAIVDGKGVIVRSPAGDDIDIAVQLADYFGDKTVGNFEYGIGGIRPIATEAVGGSLKRETWDERLEKYRDFNAGYVDALFHVKAITMGVNLPRAKVLIDLAGTTSALLNKQNNGRVMRLFVDEKGEPVEAEIHEYKIPELGDKQYTCLDAFQTESGELLGHQYNEDDEAPIPVSRRFRRMTASPPILGVREGVTETDAILHSEDAVLPSNVEVRSVLEAIHNDKLTIEETSNILGIYPSSLKNMLLSVGSSPEGPLNKEEVEALLMLYPKLETTLAPAKGYITVRETGRRAQGIARMLAILPYARREGIYPMRFINPETQKVEFYFQEEEAERLIQLIAENKLRRKK